MTTPSTKSKRNRRKTTWRWIRLAAWLLFLGWFGRYTYIHWTTPPAAFARGGRIAEYDQALNDLDAALVRLPKPNVTSLPVPDETTRETRDGVRLLECLKGAWDPVTRSDLASIVEYAMSPEVEAALAAIDQECRQLREARMSGRADAFRPRFQYIYDSWADGYLMIAVAAHTVRARVLHAQHNDPRAALDELRAAFWLASWGGVLMEGPVLTSSLTDVPHYELICVTRELELPPADAKQMITFLREERLLSIGDTLAFQTGLGSPLARFLDRYYTDDGHGNGWLVLSAVCHSEIGSHPSGPRSGFWNLFAPLFNDRKTMAARFAPLQRDLDRLDDLDFESAGHLSFEYSDDDPKLSVLDGPLMEFTGTIDAFLLPFRRVALSRAAAVRLALSAYKHEHGKYPAKLELLSPDYIDEVPLEPYSHEPFDYWRMIDGTCEIRPPRRLPRAVQQSLSFSVLGLPRYLYNISRD